MVFLIEAANAYVIGSESILQSNWVFFSLEQKIIFHSFLCICWNLSIGIRAIATNKERLEQLEEGLHRMELGMADRLRLMEETLNRLSEVLLAKSENPNPDNHHQEGNHHREGNDRGRLVVSSKTAKLEFPQFLGDDPTEWFNRVNQFFEFQNTPVAQEVSLASYHLEGEANQWWQWIRKTFRDEGRMISWEKFEEELWARFGPSECEDFDEALSRVKQLGTLRDYQREFEKLGNRVQGWTQKALVETFMGGLKAKIADGIRMFKPQSLKKAINLERMKDNQLARQRKFMWLPPARAPLVLPQDTRVAPATPTRSIKRLSWEQMQRKRAQGLCFNCDEHFTAGHRCRTPQLLLLAGHAGNGKDITDQQTLKDDHGGEAAEVQEPEVEPEITLHALAGWTAPRTMRMTATMGSLKVVVLIDIGSTHNFISDRLASML